MTPLEAWRNTLTEAMRLTAYAERLARKVTNDEICEDLTDELGHAQSHIFTVLEKTDSLVRKGGRRK